MRMGGLISAFIPGDESGGLIGKESGVANKELWGVISLLLSSGVRIRARALAKSCTEAKRSSGFLASAVNTVRSTS